MTDPNAVCLGQINVGSSRVDAEHFQICCGPVVTINGPGNVFTAVSTATLSGTTSFPDYVKWSNNRGGGGTCATGPGSWWGATGIVLQPGYNTITITVHDFSGYTGSASVVICYDTTPPSVAITEPTTAATYSTTLTTIDISGTASDNIGVAQVTWSNDKGGSGVCSGTTQWSASGIALQQGINTITVTATDLAGNAATTVLGVNAPPALSIAITNPTGNPTFSTNANIIGLSGTASELDPSGTVLDWATLGSITWSNNRGGNGTGTYGNSTTAPASWSVTGIVLQPRDNVITVSAADVWGDTATAVITVTWTPISVGAVRQLPSAASVYINNAVVTATTIDSTGVFVESADRSAGIKLITSQPLTVGQNVSFPGPLVGLAESIKSLM